MRLFSKASSYTSTTAGYKVPIHALGTTFLSVTILVIVKWEHWWFGLVYIFSVDIMIEKFFICLLAIFLSSLEQCQFRYFAYF